MEEDAPEPSPPPSCDINPNDIYDEGYYVAIINMANEAELWGRCFNCGKEGHRWADCTEPLKESLKQVKERANHKKQALNRGGGAGAKGVQPPPDRYGHGQPGQRQKLASPELTPSEFWNEDPRNRWFSISNFGTAILDGVETTCLIDNGARVELSDPGVRKG